MKAIVVIIKKERLWGPLIWFVLLLCVLLLGSCTGNNNTITNGKKNTHAITKSSNKTVAATAKNKVASNDFAYSYQEDEGQAAPETTNPAGATGQSSSALLPVKTEKSFERPVTASVPNYFYVKADAPQVYTIDNTKNEVVTGEKGIKVFFPAGCFALADASTPVTIELKEYATIEDMVLANLTTTSNGQIIETGGTVEVKAFANGKEVALKNGRDFKLAFPTKGNKPGMQTFYGKAEDNANTTAFVNWFGGGPESKTSASTWATNGQPNLNTNQTRVKYPDTLVDKRFKMYPQHYMERPRSTLFADSTKYASVLDFLKDNLDIHDTIANNLRGKTITAVFTVDTLGKVKAVRFKGIKYNKAYSFFNKQIVQSYKLFKKQFRPLMKNIPYELETVKSDGKKYYYNRKFTLNLEMKSTPVAARTIKEGAIAYFNGFSTINSTYAYMSQKQIDSLKQADANYYFLNASKLGWINCDRFPNVIAKTNFKIDLEPKNNRTVKVIFTDISSVMNAACTNYEFIASNIPKNKEVKLLVTEVRDGVSYYAVKKANTSSVASNFQFKPFSQEALKKDLGSL